MVGLRSPAVPDASSREARVTRVLEPYMLAAALLTIPTIVIDEASAPHAWRHVALAIDWAVWLAFVFELVVLLAVTENRGRWLREHPLEVGVVLLTPPFVPLVMQSLRVARFFRLLRLLRVGQLARHVFSLHGMAWGLIVALLAALCGGALMVDLERSQHLGIDDGLWWAVATMTTVGAGDVQTHTAAGRLIAVCLIAVGVMTIAFVTGFIVERFVRRDVSLEEEHQTTVLLAKLDDVCGRLEQVEAELHALRAEHVRDEHEPGPARLRRSVG
jgi:voltage-gated potassium channel